MKTSSYKKHILNLMCEFSTSWTDASTYFKEIPAVLIQLKEMEKDGLLNGTNLK
jgi:oxygen-independent coproporphyrinogen-3 oxidase